MSSMGWDLQRFVEAQLRGSPWGDPYEAALKELHRGRKTGHWMWYVFPQIQGLGSTDTARYFAIASLDEARAYFAHPTLGARLVECASALLATEGRTADEILGSVDTRKLRSSMTLFMRAAPEEPIFGQVLDRFFDGVADERTDERLRDQATTVPDLDSHVIECAPSALMSAHQMAPPRAARARPNSATVACA